MFRFWRIAKEKITHTDLNNPDAIVTVTNTRHSKIPFDKNYRGYCAIKENYLTSLCFQTLDGNDMLYEQPHSCYVKFLIPKVYPHTIWIGRKIELHEEKYCVGTLSVEEIKNPILDRNAEFKNQDDILENYKALNIALKRSLEWGKKFEMPLDNKLMKAIPNLSGTDIERVSRYVVQVRDDVLWEIYYQNRDTKTDALKIDARKAVTEKYPWINKGNLAALDFQGEYYAWHG